MTHACFLNRTLVLAYQSLNPFRRTPRHPAQALRLEMGALRVVHALPSKPLQLPTNRCFVSPKASANRRPAIPLLVQEFNLCSFFVRL
jgi:hypothetical protein